MTLADIQERNVAVVRTMAENGILGRWDVVRPFVADDIVLHVPETLPWGGERHGWEGYRTALMTMGAYFSEFAVGAFSFDPVGDKVVIRTDITVRVAHSGKRAAMPLLEVWQVRDGKVCDIVAYFYDTKSLVD
jgi:hypothetical protein